jgi:hypothetical protein
MYSMRTFCFHEQVPQYILDDAVWAGRGGHCNIICTQVNTTYWYFTKLLSLWFIAAALHNMSHATQINTVLLCHSSTATCKLHCSNLTAAVLQASMMCERTCHDSLLTSSLCSMLCACSYYAAAYCCFSRCCTTLTA